MAQRYTISAVRGATHGRVRVLAIRTVQAGASALMQLCFDAALQRQVPLVRCVSGTPKVFCISLPQALSIFKTIDRASLGCQSRPMIENTLHARDHHAACTINPADGDAYMISQTSFWCLMLPLDQFACRRRARRARRGRRGRQSPCRRRGRQSHRGRHGLALGRHLHACAQRSAGLANTRRLAEQSRPPRGGGGACRVLGRTHEVTAPTGLPRMMESAFGMEPRIQYAPPRPRERSAWRCARFDRMLALWRWWWAVRLGRVWAAPVVTHTRGACPRCMRQS
jgi:hypothetical protein